MESRPHSKLLHPVSNHTLTDLLYRLEAATSRLEDIASSAASFEVTDPPPGPSPSTASAVVSDSSAKKGQPSPSPSSQSAASEPAAPKTVALFDTLINDDLKPWLELSRKIGGLVQDQVSLNQRNRRRPSANTD